MKEKENKVRHEKLFRKNIVDDWAPDNDMISWLCE